MTSPDDATGPSAGRDDGRDRTPLRIAAITGAWALSLAVVGLGAHIIGDVSTLFPLDLPNSPHFLPGHLALLYVATPLVILASLVVILAPGAMTVAATGGGDRLTDWGVRAFGYAFVLRVAIHSLYKLAGGRVATLGAFLSLELAMVIPLVVILLARWRLGYRFNWPTGRTSWRRAAWLAATVFVLVVVLLPQFFWVDYLDDGLEALEAGRSLGQWVVPRFPNASGVVGLGIGMLSMAFPVHWFYALFGGFEATARLPLVLYLPVLICVLFELIELGRRPSRRLGPLAEAALIAAVGAFAVTMAFNASYDPYSADIAAPTAFETFTTLAMAASLLFLWRDQPGWFILFAVLGYLARPTGLLFLLLLALAVPVVPKERRKRWIFLVGSAIAACLVVFLVYEKLMLPGVREGPAAYGSGSILERFQYLTFTDFNRLLYVLIPGGLLPPLGLLLVRRQDAVARSVTVVVTLYFLFFLIPAYVALHHFAPLMVLPAVVFWRIVPELKRRRLATGAALVAAIVAVALAVPPHVYHYRGNRQLARHIVWSAGSYSGDWSEYRTALESRFVLFELFPPAWTEGIDPSHTFTPTPNALVYYVARPDLPRGDPRYAVLLEGMPPPTGGHRVGEREGATAYVLDEAKWNQDRRRSYPTDFRSPWFSIPRHELFPHLGEQGRDYDLDVGSLPFFWRFF